MNKYRIYTLDESDWREYKAIRLESLRDSPDSFGSTYEREIAFTEKQWKSRLRSKKDNVNSILWVAAAEKDLIGLLSMVLNLSNPGRASLYQMWVGPAYRKIGVGTALLNLAMDEATHLSVDSIYLSVTTSNTDAISIYSKKGFAETGSTELLREGSDLESQIMKLSLGASNA